MTNFNWIKKMLNGSTTMPQGTAGGSNLHYHNGVACNHDHSHDHSHDIGPEHSHDHKHHKDGSCCDHGDNCSHDDKK